MRVFSIPPGGGASGIALVVLLATAIASTGAAQGPSSAPTTADSPPVGSEVAPPPTVDLEGDEVHLSLGPTTGLVFDAPAVGARLELHFAAWLRTDLDIAPGADAALQFDVPLARPLLMGSFFHDRVRFLFQPELAGPAPRLLDMQLEVVLDPAFVLRFGQFRTPFGRAFLTPIVRLTFPDRGLVSDTFRLDRDTGLQIGGTTPGGVFEYAVGVFNGARINGRIGDLPTPTAMARLVLNLGAPVDYEQSPGAEREVPPGAAIGVGAAYRRWRFPEDNPDGAEESVHVGADLTVAAGPFMITSEGYLTDARTELTDWDLSWGAFVQTGVFVQPWLEVAARASWMDPSVEGADDLIQVYEGGLNLYPVIDDVALGHHWKASLRYGFEQAAASFGTRVVEGERHRVTLQFQLWI